LLKDYLHVSCSTPNTTLLDLNLLLYSLFVLLDFVKASSVTP
jgi:hypothetical protein